METTKQILVLEPVEVLSFEKELSHGVPLYKAVPEKLGCIERNMCEVGNRKLLDHLRSVGFLSETTKRLVRVDNNGYRIRVEKKSNGEPLLEIRYSVAQK